MKHRATARLNVLLDSIAVVAAAAERKRIGSVSSLLDRAAMFLSDPSAMQNVPLSVLSGYMEDARNRYSDVAALVEVRTAKTRLDRMLANLDGSWTAEQSARVRAAATLLNSVVTRDGKVR